MLERGDRRATSTDYGIRVPLIVVSPYAKPHFVSHAVYDHTSILRFIETRFKLAALTKRDANADPLLELFDFTKAAFATPPPLPTPTVDPAEARRLHRSAIPTTAASASTPTWVRSRDARGAAADADDAAFVAASDGARRRRRHRAAGGVFEVAGTTLNIPHPYPPGAATPFIEQQQAAWRDDKGVTWAVTRDGALIGLIGIGTSSRRAFARAESATELRTPEWNRGYCTEAARAVVEFAFADGFHRVQATHLTRNPASGAVMQKIGMQHEGRLRAFVRRFDRFEDIEMYAILSDGS